MKSKIKASLAVVALLSVITTANADVYSAYSMYGYGIIGDRATSMQREMGGVGYAMQSGRQINVMNPASYASIDSLTFLWDMGANMSMQWSSDNDGKYHGFGGGLDYVTMQFPLSKFMGMSIGMVPFTQVGYSFGDDIKYGARSNQGSGGITEAYAGISGKVGRFSLGVNVMYDFGNIQNDVYATTLGSDYQSVLEHMMQIRDWNIVGGLQYKQPLNRYNNITIGATYSPKKSFHGNTWLTLQEIKKDSKADTIAFDNMKGKFYSPQTLGIGLSYTHEKVHKILVEADFTWQQWSKAPYSSISGEYGNNDKFEFGGMQFTDRRKFALGGEYTHNVRGSYVERIPWRAGLFYTSDYLKISGNTMKEFGASIGAGFAAPKGKTMINFGLEWRHRQTNPVNMLNENYFNIMLGVNFNEVMFYKRKIN